MVFEYKTESAFHAVPQLEGAPKCVHFTDVFSTKDQSAVNPLVGSMFYLDFADKPEPAPKYDYDETGVVVRGELHVKDETGKTAVLSPGDTFFVHRGSEITFSTPRYALAYKCAGRKAMGH